MPDAAGGQLIQNMLDAGGPPDQVAAWKAGLEKKMLAAGAPPDKVREYWGEAEPDTRQLTAQISANMGRLSPDEHAKVAQNPVDMFRAGLQMSSTSLVTGPPNTVAPEHSGLMGKILYHTGEFVGDMPETVAGFVGGAIAGAPTGPLGSLAVGGAAGAALPEAIREIAMDHYRNGGFTSWGDLWSRAASIVMGTSKAAITGAIAAPAGGVVGGKLAEVGANAVVAGGANVATQAAAGTAVGAALEGRVPTADDFLTGAALAVGFDVAGRFVGATQRFIPSAQTRHVASNLMDIYAKTGLSPSEVVQAAHSDPAIASEVMAPRRPDGERSAPLLQHMAPAEPEPYKAHMDVEVPPSAPREEGAKPPKTGADFLDLFGRLEGSGDESVSPAGAIGHWQIMPATARQYGFDPAMLHDREYNEKVATAILNDLAKRYVDKDGNPDVAAMAVAYNAGPGRADAWIRGGRVFSDLPIETQHYLEHAERLGAFEGGYGARQMSRQLAVWGDTRDWVPPDGAPPLPPPPEQPALEGPEGGKPFELNSDMLADKILDIVGQEPAKGLPDWLNPRRIIAQFQSQLAPARRLDERFMGKERQENIGAEDMLRQTFGSKERAGYFVRYGILDPVTLRPRDDANMMLAFRMVKNGGGDLKKFMAYRLAMRTIEKQAQGIDTGVDISYAHALITKLRAEGKLDAYRDGADVLRRVKDGTIDYARDSGLFSDKQAEDVKALNREHVVMRRIIEPDYTPPAPGRGFGVRTPIKTMSGSDRQIVDPMTTDIDNLHTIIAMADRNRAIGSIIRMVRGAGDETNNDFTQVGEIGEDAAEPKEMLDENGRPIAADVAKGAAPFELFRKAKMGPGDFTYMNNGRLEIWHTNDHDLADVLRLPWPGKVNPIAQMFAKVAGLQRAGITGQLDFPFRAVLHGQLAASALAPHGSWLPYHDVVSGFMDVWHKGEAYRRWVANGGAGAALADMDTNYLRRDIERIWDETGSDNAVWNSLRHPILAMRAAQHFVDAAARVGYMKRAENAGLRTLKAATESRTAYLDHGELMGANWVNTWARMVPFMPIGFKDAAQVTRALRDRPLGTLMKAGAILTLPTVVNYAANILADQTLDEKDRYQQVPRWERDMYWVLPPIGGVRLKIKRPYAVGWLFATMPERSLDAIRGEGSSAIEWAKSIIDQVMPPMTPAVLAPMIQQYANTSWTGRPLIPGSLEKASGYMQYSPDTTMTARKVSRVLGPPGINLADVSPIVLDNYAREWAGTLPMTILQSFEAPFRPPGEPWQAADLPFVKAFLVRQSPQGMQSLEDFYTQLSAFTAAHADMALALKHGDFSEIADGPRMQAAMNLSNYQEAIHNQLAVLAAINASDMTDAEKRKYTDSIASNMLALAKGGITMMQSVR